MPRVRNQTARRQHLTHSAVDAIGRRGLAGLRVRDVADAAGVSTGTVHYYFSDLDELLYEVHGLTCDRFFHARLSAVAEHEDARAKLLSMIDNGLPGSADDATVAALYELGIARRTNPIHRMLLRGLYDRQVALYLGIIELGRSQGHFQPGEPAADIGANLVALEDAYGLHIVTGNASLPPRRCRELILSYARSATGCAELTDIDGDGGLAGGRPGESEAGRAEPGRAEAGVAEVGVAEVADTGGAA